MYYNELQTIVFSLIKKDDPYRAAKEIQLKNWCRAFLILFTSAGRGYLPFFLDILSDENCWEHSLHSTKLNRRIVAKKMMDIYSWKGKLNPLDDIRRFQVACWCCLKEDVFDLFTSFKQQYHIANDDAVSIKRLVKTLSKGSWSDSIIGFWSHIMGDCVAELRLDGKHLFEYGLYDSLHLYRRSAYIYAGHVEAVEFFWNGIKSLDESVLSCHKKYEIFMETTIRAASDNCCEQPEIFEFCISQLSVDLYPEFLKREISVNGYYCSFSLLHKMLSFDKFQMLFDCFQPNDISEDMYHAFLTSSIVEPYSEYYRNKALNLFLHIWRKEGFEMHRNFVLRKELTAISEGAPILSTLVKKHYMEPVWAVLDEADPYQICEFMNSKEACYIRSLLEIGDDTDSLNKFLSYRMTINELAALSFNQVNFFRAHIANYTQ